MDVLRDVHDFALNCLDRAFVLTATTLILFIALYCLYVTEKARAIHRRRVWHYWRGTPMSVRREIELVSDAITDGLEELYFRHKITKRQRDRWYARFAAEHHLTDLVPRKKTVGAGWCNELKHRIWSRIATGLYEQKPKLPDETFVVIKGEPKKRGAVLGKRKIV